MRQKVFLDIREVPKILECVVKNIGGKILRLLTIVNTPTDESVRALTIVLVKLGPKQARSRCAASIIWRSAGALLRRFNADCPATFASN